MKSPSRRSHPTKLVFESPTKRQRKSVAVSREEGPQDPKINKNRDALVLEEPEATEKPQRRVASTPSNHRHKSPARATTIASTLASTPTAKQPKVSHSVVTPSTTIDSSSTFTTNDNNDAIKARRRLPFDSSSSIQVSPTVKQIYKIVRRLTGSIGGNGSFGAIYGELTMGSMQKMVDLMKLHTGLSSNSRFIDVGSGIGKPSLHVAQDPGVGFSYGIEMERSRWLLGMTSLHAVLQEGIQLKCMFDLGNIKQAKTLDPFTHVYMFSIGFPPSLWKCLATMFNASASPYLICFHSPRIIVERYGFQVQLLAQTPTSMHGSSEGHTGYIYQRTNTTNSTMDRCCDPVFSSAVALAQDATRLQQTVQQMVQEQVYASGRVTRAKKVVHCIESDHEDELERGTS